MSISIIDRSSLATDEGRDFAERRLLFALSRFSNKIRDVTLVIRDQNGPRGGIDKHCRVTANLIGGPKLVINETSASLDEGVARAADRLGRAVARAIERSRSFPRSRVTDNPISIH